MRKDREQANVLRRSGKSYSEIIEQMKVPRSTLSAWFKNRAWSEEVANEQMRRVREGSKIRLSVLNVIRGNRLRQVYVQARQDATVDYSELKYHPLFIAGIMAYWSHGERSTRQRISFSSSDERKIRIFYLFLTEVCSCTSISVRLLINKAKIGQENEARGYWAQKIGLKPDDFGKTNFYGLGTRSLNGSVMSKNGPEWGICNISVSSAYLKCKILHWIELFGLDITSDSYSKG